MVLVLQRDIINRIQQVQERSALLSFKELVQYQVPPRQSCCNFIYFSTLPKADRLLQSYLT